MTDQDDYGYGLWGLVLLSTALTVFIAFSFFHPKTKHDWRAMGGFSAFAVALFTEMYGFPLTIFLLSGPLGDRFPNLGLSHGQGHLWNDLIGWKADPHISPFHVASYVLIGGGFLIVAAAWRTLLAAQRERKLATSALYARVRHPQYLGLLLVMVGYLLQWPTLPTLVMFPVLVWLYRRLAIAEDREVARAFGRRWERYARRTPRFLPRLGWTQAAPARTR